MQQLGSCEEWLSSRPTTEAPGVELECYDYFVEEPNPIGIAAAVIGVLLLVGLIFIGGMAAFYENDWGDESDDY